jgi:hypothetical protein
MSMSELILIVWLAISNALMLWIWLAQRSKNMALLRLCTTIIKAISAQRDINGKQHEINNSLGQNLEILGVHTKLIPPSIAMEAEAFLAWHNKRKEERDKNG